MEPDTVLTVPGEGGVAALTVSLVLDVDEPDLSPIETLLEPDFLSVLSDSLAAHPWHNRDNLIVRRVPPGTPVQGQICRRAWEKHPYPASPASTISRTSSRRPRRSWGSCNAADSGLGRSRRSSTAPRASRASSSRYSRGFKGRSAGTGRTSCSSTTVARTSSSSTVTRARHKKPA